MGKRDRIKRVFQDFCLPRKASASESASTISNITLEPHLSEPTERACGAPSTNIQSQDLPVRDLWGLALEKLPEEAKQVMSQITLNSNLDFLRHLNTVVAKKQSDCENQRWKFQLHGREIILRDVAGKIIFWMEKVKQIGDIAVSFDPVHASLPWAGIRILLEVRFTITEKENRSIKANGVADNRG